MSTLHSGRSPLSAAAPHTMGDTATSREGSNTQSAPCKVLLDYVVPDRTDAPSSAGGSRSGRALSDQVILDHKGPVRLQLHPDGSFTCDPCNSQEQPPLQAPQPQPQPPPPAPRLSPQVFFDTTLRLIGTCAITTGFAAGWLVLLNNAEHSTPMELFLAISETTSCAIAGVLTGFLMGPMIAANALCKSLARPALLGGALHCVRLLMSNLGGVSRLVARLQSSDVLAQLDAVQKIAAKAARSERFRQAFHRYGGMEGLLRLLAANPQGAAASLIANALAQLVSNADCKDAVVSCGGVGLVAQLLDHHDALTVANAAVALAHLSSHSLAQDSLRDLAVVPKLVRLLQGNGSMPYDTPQYCVQALINLAGDPANRAAMVQAGAVPVLATLLRDVSALSEVKAVAVALLHLLARSNPDVAQALADLEDLSTILHRLLAALGPLWHPAKADIHALLNTLSRTPASMLGGDAPIMVCPPARLGPELLQPQRSRSSLSAASSTASSLLSGDQDHGVEGSGIGGMDYVTLS